MSAPARHAAPEPAPARTDEVASRPDRGRARALVLLSLACAALLIAAPLAIVRTSLAQDGTPPESDVLRGADPDPGEDADGGTGTAPLPEATPVLTVAPPALDTAGTDDVPGAPARGDAGATQGGAPQPGTMPPGTTQPRTTRIQILPSNPAPAPAQQPAPQPEPATDAEGVLCPCTLVGGVLVSLSRLVGGVLQPAGGLLGP